MNQFFNHCFECVERERPYPPLPKSFLKIHQANKKLAPWIHRAINHNWDLK